MKYLLINSKLHLTLNNMVRQSFWELVTVHYMKINATGSCHLGVFATFPPCSCGLVLSDHLQLTSISLSPNQSGHCFNDQHCQFTVHLGTDVKCTVKAPNPKLKIAEIRWLKKTPHKFSKCVLLYRNVSVLAEWL